MLPETLIVNINNRDRHEEQICHAGRKDDTHQGIRFDMCRRQGEEAEAKRECDA